MLSMVTSIIIVSWSFVCVTFVSTIIPYEATLNISNCGACNPYRNMFVWIG